MYSIIILVKFRAGKWIKHGFECVRGNIYSSLVKDHLEIFYYIIRSRLINCDFNKAYYTCYDQMWWANQDSIWRENCWIFQNGHQFCYQASIKSIYCLYIWRKTILHSFRSNTKYFSCIFSIQILGIILMPKYGYFINLFLFNPALTFLDF